MPPFTLPKQIFNANLYRLIQTTWFGSLPEGSLAAPPEVLKKWWTDDAESKSAFDNICRTNFIHALDAIGPEKYRIPSTASQDIAEPFLREINEAAEKDEKNKGAEGARTALSMILLLDQVTRNVYRTADTLPLVYKHYDVIAQSLSSALMSSPARPDLHPIYRLSPPYRLWFYLPMMHSENLTIHQQGLDAAKNLRASLEKEGVDDEGALEYTDRSVRFEVQHMGIVERFGRFPHRNWALGRESTVEEVKWLEEGGETFGVAKA